MKLGAQGGTGVYSDFIQPISPIQALLLYWHYRLYGHGTGTWQSDLTAIIREVADPPPGERARAFALDRRTVAGQRVG